MHQVLLNLINNAVEAIDPEQTKSGKIQILVAHDKPAGRISIEISDNGPGVRVDDIEAIFEPRFTTKKKGHGLGLSNCKRIIESHSGEITVISDGIEGATFRIVLPIRQPKSETK